MSNTEAYERKVRAVYESIDSNNYKVRHDGVSMRHHVIIHVINIELFCTGVVVWSLHNMGELK